MPHDEQRLRVTVHGAVQGVGFRPFIYRLATDLGLVGWVNNSSQGVFIEVEGDKQDLETFLLRLQRERPPRSFIQSLESSFLDPVGYQTFEIRHSDESGAKTALILPDIAACPDCLREIFDKTNRRFRYPFTNCTHCGPRFSIIEALPYDRPNTTMKHFTLCDSCRSEYEDPLNRRFHAQPTACPQCGPHLEFWDHQGNILVAHDGALLRAVDAIRQGKIVAVKGLGGFHLIVDARNEEAVERLRQRKHREEKPLALMYPSLELAKADCEISELEERLLTSPESPIVLLRRRPSLSQVAPAIAPRNPYLGIMLPYTPLHHLLMTELGLPVVATSGNLSDEPICTDEREALDRLGGIAELFLVHNRPIARHVDDSIARVMAGREIVLRRARGYAPLPIHLKEPILSIRATGAHLKNSIALGVGQQAFISQHIGDLETPEALRAFHRVISDFESLYETRPKIIACDAHPDYLSTKYAQQQGLPVVKVQHHFAHLVSCMTENELEGPVLGVSWDGTGYGLDGTIWGGEFLWTTGETFRRVAHFRQFHLPGGESAVKEPRRSALGLLYEIYGDALFAEDRARQVLPLQAFSARELALLQPILQKRVNSPLTSSVGRLFDAVAAIVGLSQDMSFEGQAAMELEFALGDIETDAAYTLKVLQADQDGFPDVVDWRPMIHAIIADMDHGVPRATMTAKFHNALVEAIIAVARRMGEEHVVLTGGCFQNKYLTERAIRRLQSEGFRPYWHQRVPPNDGGIALGQIVAAAQSKE